MTWGLSEYFSSFPEVEPDRQVRHFWNDCCQSWKNRQNKCETPSTQWKNCENRDLKQFCWKIKEPSCFDFSNCVLKLPHPVFNKGTRSVKISSTSQQRVLLLLPGRIITACKAAPVLDGSGGTDFNPTTKLSLCAATTWPPPQCASADYQET